MSNDSLGEMPEPQAVEPEKFPGGVDSLEDEEKYGERSDIPMGSDLPAEKNPAAEDILPSLREPDAGDDDAPTSDGASEPEKETQV